MPWFTERLRGSIVSMIVEGVASAGATLVAYAVMPNHVHIILAQGRRTLGWTLQPVFRRVALLVQRAHGTTGHVFERRFRSKPCLDQDYVRTAVLYTHLNPVRAGICTSVYDYAWTSHHAYSSDGEQAREIIPDDALRLFATRDTCTDRDELRAEYLACLESWQRTMPIARADQAAASVATGLFFADRFCVQLDGTAPIQSVDLRDRAQSILRLIERDCDLDMLRGSYIGRRASRIRRQLIAALLTADYRGAAIANLFKVSTAAVSQVSAQIRWQRS